jgi:outer membrane receptor protein involved in Fe transport
MSKKVMLGRFLTSTMLTGVAATAATPVFAQDDEDEASDDRIVVTGSRIAREDLGAPSPVATVDAEQLVLTNTVNSEQFLNTLPQVIPSLDSTSNNPGNGTATVNLRGLGTQRTLVLVDGTRFVASGPGQVVDINTIPTALVERVEVVTGGASAVYGSDAMAGVVNFILKDDFEGVQLDISDQLSAAGWDANIFNVALTAGGNFADGKGNAIMALSYTNRDALFQGERDFSRFTLQEVVPGTFNNGGSGSPLGGQFIELGTGSFAASGFYPCVSAPGATCSGNVTFRVFGGDATLPAGRRFTNPADQYNYAPTNYLQLPQERYSIYAGASYEISDNIEVYARGVFANSAVDQQLAPTPVGNVFDLNLDNPNLHPTFLAALLAIYTGPGQIADRDGDGQVDDIRIQINRRYTELGTRNSLHDANSMQLKLGFRGDLSDSWSYDLYGQFGRTNATDAGTGNASFRALQAGILDGSCNVFGVDTMSAACVNAVSVTALSTTRIEQTQIVGSLNGELDNFVFPWAESGVSLAIGAEYREEFSDFLPDSAGGPDIRGFNPSLPVSGRYDVYEAFMETQIPIIEGKTFFESFVINGGYRYSDYSTVGSVHTYFVGGEWEPVENLRFRAQFQHATRAPNIAELFTASVSGFPGAKDPCSGGAFGSFVPANAAQCSLFGVPVPGAAFQLSGQIEALFGGNPNLSEENADSLTIGMVWQPDFVEGLVLQVDYYDIEVKDAVFTLPLQSLLNGCYVSGIASICTNSFGPGTRDPATGAMGAPFLVNLGASNIANLQVSGIDFLAEYGFDIGTAGSLNFNYYGSYTLKNGYTEIPGDPFIECAGAYDAGQICGEPTPEYKHTMQAGWLWGPLTTSVRWRLIGGTQSDVVTPAFLSYDIGMFNYIDVTLQYAVNENLDLTVGVQNITGKDAPLLASITAEQANTFPATYTTLGRQVFFGASVRF